MLEIRKKEDWIFNGHQKMRSKISYENDLKKKIQREEKVEGTHSVICLLSTSFFFKNVFLYLWTMKDLPNFPILFFSSAESFSRENRGKTWEKAIFHLEILTSKFFCKNHETFNDKVGWLTREYTVQSKKGRSDKEKEIFFKFWVTRVSKWRHALLESPEFPSCFEKSIPANYTNFLSSNERIGKSIRKEEDTLIVTNTST